MTSGRRWWPVGGSLILVIGLLAIGWPYVSSVLHLEAGGRALRDALDDSDALLWWYTGSKQAQDRRALQRAIAHLEQAPKLLYAQRLLGRAYFAQPDALSDGDLDKGVRALEQFVDRRPDHTLARLELAAAYALVDQRLQAIEYVDLLDNLVEAMVSAPDIKGAVRYRKEGWESDYVYPTTFGLPPNYGDRPTLFVHAGAQVTLTLPIDEPSVFRFGMALDPRSLNWGGDGATFEVFVDGERVFLEHLPVERAGGGWQERQVDLARFMGRTVHLSMATTPGPTGDVAADWAGWGEPRLEAPQAVVYRQMVNSKPWIGIWNEAGINALDFIRAGQVARKAQQYEDALTWYRWADRALPGRGDPWYYAGLVYEDQERWADALDAYQRGLELSGFRHVRRSSLYYRVGMIYQWRLEPRQPGAALAAYEAALKENKFGSAREKADCHYRRGEILWWQKADPDAYIAEFERAIELDPEFTSAHILLGVALYARDQDATLSEARIRHALELSPQNKWAYYYLGEIDRQEGQLDKAKADYRRALEFDPSFEIARQRLQALEAH